jgi:hypothetical protein
MPSADRVDGEETSRVAIPDRLLSRIEERLAHTGFETTAEWITYVLEETLVRVEDTTDEPRSRVVTEAEVERRLESLGYLDDS